jgi:pimeloyl-ACP methyl ester carboxylesterase
MGDRQGTASVESELNAFDAHRREVSLGSGPASVVDTGGEAPAAVFVHGVGTSSYLWRHVVAAVGSDRRCVALDLPLHGRTPATRAQAFGLPALAEFVADCCAALGLDKVDLVANDTGGAVAQVFAASYPQRVRSLVLTNCEVHDNVPPRAFLPTALLARVGLLARLAPHLMKDLPTARRRIYGAGYQDLNRLPDEVVRAWLEPLMGDREAAQGFQRWINALKASDLRAAEPGLRTLTAPTLVVWGTDDIFFHLRWAYRLRDLIPTVTEVVEVPGGRLFFPDERPEALVEPLRRMWRDHPS